MPERAADQLSGSDDQNENDDNRTERIALRVRMVEPEGMTIQFANHLTSQFTADEFILTFAQIVPPTGAELTDDEFQQLTHVSAKVVSRIGLSPKRMRQLIDVLQSNYDRYLTQQAGEEDN
ncbi:MAG TPA: DUF3467 domain-containing protein [Nitrolancea sp.]|nr:DUF3467 domain-containing protein [Nitrolancea sp.]